MTKIVWTNDKLVEFGFTLATSLMDADNKAAQTKRDLLLQAAKEHAGDIEHTKAILEGVANAYKESGAADSVVRVRKTETKAVFDAVAATLVSGENYAKLEDFEGTYAEWIGFARTLRGVNERASTSRNRSQKLTDKQQEQFEKKMDVASPGQLVDIASVAIESLNKNAPPTLAGYQTLLMIQLACNQLVENPTVEDFFKTAANRILKITDDAIERAQKAMQAAAAIGDQTQHQKGVVQVSEAAA